jgi:hypothetical protein
MLSEYKCPAAPQVSNANVTVEVLGPLCKASYECQTGFEYLTGNLIRYSQGDSDTWNGTRLICEVLRCDDPPQVPNSVITVEGYEYLSSSIYTCSWLFNQTGGSNIKTCSADKAWIGDDIICKSELPSPRVLFYFFAL